MLHELRFIRELLVLISTRCDVHKFLSVWHFAAVLLVVLHRLNYILNVHYPIVVAFPVDSLRALLNCPVYAGWQRDHCGVCSLIRLLVYSQG